MYAKIIRSPGIGAEYHQPFSTASVQVGLPHVGADELDLGRELFSDDGEETLEGFQGAFLATQSKRVIP